MDRLEQTLSLKLINSRRRPFITYTSEKTEVVALFDSGALTPVWCKGEKKLLRAYPAAKEKSNEKCAISGFGENPIIASVYVLPEFVLTDGHIVFKIVNLQIAVCRHPAIGCDFVLSDTMFSYTDTLIQRRIYKQLEISFDKSEYYCTPIYENNRFTVTTWAQD